MALCCLLLLGLLVWSIVAQFAGTDAEDDDGAGHRGP